MSSTPHLWATAPSLEAIASPIRRFYCQPDTSRPIGREIAPGVWEVLKSDGTVIPSVQVRRKGARYRFEDRPAS